MKSSNAHFFTSLLISRLSDQMLLFLVPLVIYQLTGSVAWSGLAFFFETLPRFLAFPVCGQLCDRYRNDWLLRLSQRWRLAACVAAILGYLALPDVAWLIGLAASVGVLSTQGVMAREMLLVQAFGAARYERLISQAQLFDQAGTVLGPLVAASLLARLEWETVVVVIALGFAASDLAVWRWQRVVRPVLPVPRANAANGYRALRIAARHLRASPALPASIGLAMAVNLLLGTLLATAPAVVTGVQDHGEVYYGMLQAGGALATVGVLLFTARSLIPPDRLGLVAYVAMALGGLMASVTTLSSLYALGFLLVMGFDKMFSVSIRSLRRRVIPADDFGKTTGLVMMLNNLTQPLGGLIVSATAGGMATGSILLAVALVMVVAGGFIVWGWRAHLLPSLTGR
ncbi:MFS transporter [Salinicola aestuarinus]|uniref:MFS transporter n=1 Tax=Salinicola aestuarinus TaxID=1949082 RepID=UPI001300B177|nr:MFS transporter [Salinicola aestuarinus]